MDMLIVTTESHRVLSESIFRPSIPPAAGVDILERQLDLAEEGGFESASWQKGVTAKLGWALDHMAAIPPDTVFALSDVDIQFFPGFVAADLEALLDRSGSDVLFQKEHTTADSVEVNTGFYVARNRPWFRDLLERAVTQCDGLEVKNDQTAVNEILNADDLGRHWGFLPTSYYARSQGFPPKPGIVLHHANYSGSVTEKIGQLNRVRRYVTGGIGGKALALGGEGWNFIRSGKLRLAVRMKVKGQ